ncbi:hypothetical protein H5410_020523 [Solanum commersonii]|uniref:Uncharacterized protein n=1 Tax=Solanum commersonii TaxID=4109 RepID=A0A9J5Z9A9_SOLCO|nr:hypothetical protein H5410_020523 [Solanum commersonii]
MGNPVTQGEIQDFSDSVQHLSLNELSWKGEIFTWKKKQPGANRIWSRLDGNFDWMMNWGYVQIEYDLPMISDHSPMVLKLHAAPQLRALKPLLKKLNNREFKNVRQQIDNVRIELKVVQAQFTRQCSNGLINVEKTLLQNLEKWSLIEENIVKQKSRARWINLGDSNTKYFSAVMKERTQRKQISEIMALSGDIQREIVDLYMSLMGSTATVLPAIDQLVMRRGPTLTIAQQTSLRTEVTDQEILDSLHGIDDDKAPDMIVSMYISSKKHGQ